MSKKTQQSYTIAGIINMSSERQDRERPNAFAYRKLKKKADIKGKCKSKSKTFILLKCPVLQVFQRTQ